LKTTEVKKILLTKNIMKDEILNSIKSARPKGKQGFYFEMALFLVLGFLVGVAVKTEAAKRVTIGFNDYKVVSLKQGYSFSEIQKNLAEKQKAAQENAESGEPVSENGSCGS